LETQPTEHKFTQKMMLAMPFNPVISTSYRKTNDFRHTSPLFTFGDNR